MIKIAACCMAAVAVLLGTSPALAGPPEPEPFIVGKARVTALQDMPGEMPLSIFRGGDKDVMAAEVPSGKVPAGVTVFLVQNGGLNMLVDTGYGASGPDRASALFPLLESVGLHPGDIDMVLLTHMHGDHVGGLLKGGKAAFPKAQVLVCKHELEFWTAPATLAEKPDLKGNIDLVGRVMDAYGDRVKPFAFQDTVAPEIIAHAAQGHTPGHTLFVLASKGERLVFWGDIVHGAAVQFGNPDICAVYDMDMPEAVATRREVFKKTAAEGIPVAGAHLPYPAIGRVTKTDTGGEFAFVPGL